MNTKHLHKIIITAFVIISLSDLCQAQFEMNTAPPGLDFGRTQFTAGPAGNDIFSVGIGNFGGPLGLGLVPLSALHVNTNILPPSPNHGPGEVFRTDCPVGANSIWRMFRGGADFGWLFSSPANTDFTFRSPRGSLQFQTANTNPYPNGNLRLFVSFEPTAANFHLNAPRVLIPAAGFGPFQPDAYLHLGKDAATNGGWRPWMNVGVLMVSDTIGTNTDNMYVGIKQLAVDRVDAIINWGNNPTTQTVVDRLRFVFTAATGLLVNAAGVEGIEIARMVSDGNFGRMGIGGDINPAFNNAYTGINGEPGNTVEINSSSLNQCLTNTGGGSGFSGLRFTDLNSSCTPYTTNPGQGVLGLDPNGDVIYVPDLPGLSFAGPCPTSAATTLTSDFGTNFGGFNFYWEGNGSGNNSDNSMLIGRNCGVLPLGKLDVFQQAGTSGTIGIHVQNQDLSGTPAPLFSSIGIKSIMPNTADFSRIAGWFEAGGPVGANATAIYVPQNGGRVTIGYPTLFNSAGLLEVNGTIHAAVGYSMSDQSLKQNISPLQTPLTKILNLNGVNFEWVQASVNDSSMTGVHSGLIAQQVEPIIPEVIRSGSDGKKYINYDGLSPYFVESIKILNARIDSMINVNRIRQENQQIIQLESDILLYQNAPNPFSDETTIRYFIPDNGSNARMLFFDETGRILKEEPIQNLGDGTITLKTSGLASGIYTYALEVNGKIIQSRKMQKVK